MRHLTHDLLRGFALFLGLFALANLGLSAVRGAGYDASIWWIDLRGLPGPAASLFCLGFGLALVHRAVCPLGGGVRLQRFRRAALWVLAVWLLVNALVVWRLHLMPGNGVTLGLPVPLSLVTAALVAALNVWPVGAPEGTSRPVRSRPCAAAAVLVGCLAAALLSPLAQMTAFGETDYRRPADAIVVYGCRAYADGRPSQALADRVHTACELYHQGLAPCIVMSGGPGDGDIHETQAMKDYAVSLGVPPGAILRDTVGLDTRATAANLPKVLADQGIASGHADAVLLAVSHDYHLPRAKLTLEREGFIAYTVPAEIRRGLPSKPYLMVRETAAWWVYWGRS
ncbi:MAG: YdcF family protein [Planctomycetota bacterium]